MPALKQAEKLADPTAMPAEVVAAIIQAFNDRIGRLEILIRDEIRDLKNEQIADLKILIERADKNAHDSVERLANDQGRLWDALRALERDRDRGTGALKAIHYVIVTAAGAFGAVAAAVLARLWK